LQEKLQVAVFATKATVQLENGNYIRILVIWTSSWTPFFL
jgi:hypothetical protein